jgi:hypothetical protein
MSYDLSLWKNIYNHKIEQKRGTKTTFISMGAISFEDNMLRLCHSTASFLLHWEFTIHKCNLGRGTKQPSLQWEQFLSRTRCYDYAILLLASFCIGNSPSTNVTSPLFCLLVGKVKTLYPISLLQTPILTHKIHKAIYWYYRLPCIHAYARKCV